MPDIILETQNLKKYFKTRRGMLHAVDGVNLRIERGKTLGIVGESGCGKSTLGRTIVHLYEPTAGKILFNGTDISQLKKKEQKRLHTDMQMIFQDPFSSLNPRMSVQELILEPMLVNDIYDTREQVYAASAKLMDIVGLAKRLASAYPHELDGGRRQRIGIARALSVGPTFIVCDEPVSALDVSIQAQILNLLMNLQDEMGLTYMFITHDLSVVKHISNEIAVMYMGQVVEKAASDELFAHPLHPYTQALIAAIPTPDIDDGGFSDLEPIKGEVVSPVNPAPGCRFAVRCPYASSGCTDQELTLKEVRQKHYVACPYIETEEENDNTKV